MDADRDGPFRWVLAILIVAAIMGLLAIARGEPERGGPRVALAVEIREIRG